MKHGGWAKDYDRQFMLAHGEGKTGSGVKSVIKGRASKHSKVKVALDNSRQEL